MNSLFATLILDWPRDAKFEGCNKVLCDAIEKLDTQCVEVRQSLFRFRPNIVELVLEIWTSYDDDDKQIRDEDEAHEFMLDRIQAAGLDCRVNINCEESEFCEKSDAELKHERAENYTKEE
jgi:hypothetical protein